MQFLLYTCAHVLTANFNSATTKKIRKFPRRIIRNFQLTCYELVFRLRGAKMQFGRVRS